MTRGPSSRRPSASSAGRAVELGAKRDRLGLVDRDRGRVAATVADAGQQLADHRFGRPSAQVPQGLLDGDPLRALRGDPADAAEGVVGPIAGGADDHGDRRGPSRGPRRDALGDIEDGGDPCLVVGEVDDDHPRAEAVEVEAARRALGRRAEVEQAVVHVGDGRAHRPRPAARGERVRDVVAGQPADRDRDPGDLDDRCLTRALGLDDPSIADEVRASARRHVPSHER